MRTVAVILASVVVLLTSGCSNPKNLLITETNKETLLGEIKDSKSLTVEEVQLLQGYLMRYAMADGLKSLNGGKNELPLEGKTVGELIVLQRQWAEDLKTEEARQKRLAEEAKAKKDAVAAELRKSITLTVFDKGFVDSNWQASRYEDLMTYSITYKNNSSMAIRAFQGQVVFQDLFGDKVNGFNLKISDPIGAGETATWRGTTKFNQFDDEDVRLRNTDLKDLKVVWVPERIIFADGTTIPDGPDSSD